MEGRRTAKKARNDRSDSCVRADSTSSLPSRPRKVQARVSCSAADGRRFVLGEAGLVVEAGEVARVVALHVLAALLLAVPGFADDTERGIQSEHVVVLKPTKSNHSPLASEGGGGSRA